MNFASFKEKIGLNRENSKSQFSENFLALTLTPNSVTACVWYLLKDKVKVVGLSQKHFENLENLTHEAAVAIDKATEKADSDVTKVVFGLTQNWFEKDSISHEATKLLTGLSRDLDLSAQAFVALATAVNHFLKVEENVTPNAVLVGLFDRFCEAYLVNNNKIISSQSIKAKPEIGAIVELIQNLKEKNDQLPSRIVVYGNSEENLNHKMASRNWQDLFMHEPKIELLDMNELAQAVAYAQAADMIGHEPALPSTMQTEQLTHEPKHAPSAPLTENFGFVADQDILETPVEEPEDFENPSPGDDLSTEEPEPESRPEPETQRRREDLKQEDYAVDIANVERAPMPHEAEPQMPQRKAGKRGFKFPQFLNIFPKFKARYSLKGIAIAVVTLFVIVAIGIFIAGQTLTSAQVVIKVNAKPQEADFTAQAVTGSGDIEKGQIPGTLVTGKADGDQKMIASGTKKTGTKATGKMLIQNWVKESKTFPAGTEVITKDGIKFILDKEVLAASGSAHPPGEVEVAATAADIGSKYNINSGVDLSIVGFDDFFYSAKTNTGFTGGDEKQTTVASEDDLSKLEKSQTETLIQKAKDDINNNSQGRKIYTEAETVKVVKKDFDKKADEEASIINLNMALEVTALTFDESDLKTYLAKTAQDSAESHFEARSENIEILDLKVKNQQGSLVLTGKFRANLTPKIDEDGTKDKIAGLSTKKAREIIKGVAEVSDVQVIISPSIPFIDMLPKNKSKITFKIEKN